jgi:hypothetical protein
MFRLSYAIIMDFTAVYLKHNGYATVHYNYISHYFPTHYSQHTDQRLMFVRLILIVVDTDTYMYYSRDDRIVEQIPKACPKK